MSKDEPATKKDVENIVKSALKQGFSDFREEMRDLVADTAKAILEVVRDENQKTRAEFEEFVRKENVETRNHFDAVAETIHQDLVGANKDEIAGIQNTQENHEERITTLEERAGVR